MEKAKVSGTLRAALEPQLEQLHKCLHWERASRARDSAPCETVWPAPMSEKIPPQEGEKVAVSAGEPFAAARAEARATGRR
mmetsp:Transcript_67720/g.122094  ORF Transcript_67720/g.122094 Transcript_67720/m.122094 type:complete len:81 (-) Transcript_67720:380-622(-)